MTRYVDALAGFLLAALPFIATWITQHATFLLVTELRLDFFAKHAFLNYVIPMVFAINVRFYKKKTELPHL